MKTLAETEQAQLMAALLAGELPDNRGRFGPFGGRYVPETLMPALERLTDGVHRILPETEFQSRLHQELASWVGRPTALTHAARLSQAWSGDLPPAA